MHADIVDLREFYHSPLGRLADHSIAMALASNPRALLLDEPTAGMSPEETRGMMDLILRLAQAQTVVLVEHKMKLIMGVSDRIVVLHHGEVIADGAPAEIRANAEVRRVYLGEEA